MFLRRNLTTGRILVAIACFSAFAIGIVLLLLSSGRPKKPSRELGSYYLEASIDVDGTLQSGDQAFKLQTWYQAPASYRRQYSFKSETLGSYDSIQAADGHTVTIYDGHTNTYHSVPQSEQGPAGAIPGGPLIGPLPTSTLDAFLATVPHGPGESTIGRRHPETLMGGPVDVVEIQSPGGGRMTLWVDPVFSFVLRYEALDGGQSVKVEATSFQYNPKLSQADLQFTPPAGARRVAVPTGGGSFSGGLVVGKAQIVAPPGFLTPSYLPDGWTVSGGGTSGSGSQASEFTARLQPSDKSSPAAGFLSVVEEFRVGGLSSTLLSGTPVTVGSTSGFANRTGSEQRLIFAARDIVVTLISDTLPLDELQRIAESMY